MQNKDDFSSYKASNYKKDEFSQYHASNYKKEPEVIEEPGFLERAANDVDQHINQPIEEFGRSSRNMAGGFAQGLGNIIPGLYNLGASGVNALGANIPKSPMIDLVPESPSTSAGEFASFFAGPSFLKVLGKLPQYSSTLNSMMKIPVIAHGIKHASNILSKSPTASRIAGNAVLGGAYAPENPLLGLGLGAIGGVAGEAIGKGYSGIKKSVQDSDFLSRNISKINPSAKAKELEHYLSGGTNNLTQNSQELIKDIRNAYKSREEEAGAYLNYALEKAGNEPLYKTQSMILNKPDESKGTIDKIKDLNVGDLFHAFKSKPTFSNAHALQSELGNMIGEIKNRVVKTGSEKYELAKIKSAREQLKNDIKTFLQRRDQTSNLPLEPKYTKGIELFRENVAPYLEDKKIAAIARGGKTDIKNLHQSFNTPSNKINAKGIEETGSINKILQDLPQSSRNRILFNAIGGNKLSPEELLNKLFEVKSKGYGSYFTPEIEENIEILNKRLKNKEIAKTGSKIAGIGATAGLGMNVLSHLF